MIKRSSTLTTIGGVLGAFGLSVAGAPLIVMQYYAQVVKAGPPQWFNDLILPMLLIGVLMAALGQAITGAAAKGADDHSTMAQTEAATTKAVADHVVDSTDKQPAEMPAVPITIVPHTEPASKPTLGE